MDARPTPAMLGASALLLALVTALSPLPTATATTARAPGGRHGVRIVGSDGMKRTTAQLVRAAADHPTRPHPPLAVRRGPQKVAETAGSGQAPALRANGAPAFALTAAQTFDGPALEASPNAAFPPDTQGDVGPTQFVVTLNSRFRSYTKAGVADGALDLLPDDFFGSEMTPAGCNFTSDPHIRYDRLSHRWFVVMIDVPGCSGSQSNRILIAVSDGETLTPGTVWTFFHIDAPALQLADYPTLGIDAHALYIGTNGFSTLTAAFIRTDGYVVQKSSLLGGGAIASTLFPGLAVGTLAGPFTPQGVDDPNDADPNGYFVGVDNASFGKLDVVRVANPGGTPGTAGAPTITTSSVTVPATRTPLLVPHLGNTAGSNGDLDGVDDRLLEATMTADGHLWTAHGIGVNATGGVTSPNRDGARWYELGNVSSTPTLVQSGTVFDSAATNPHFYWMPTLAVSGQGNMAVAGSVAGAASHADAWYASRLSTDLSGTTSAPSTYTATPFAYNPAGDTGGAGGRRWGDYSLTRVDPSDNQTIWTIQEYVSATDTWGVKIGRLRAPGPATPTGTSAPVVQGAADVHVTLTGASTGGSGWYDPGAGFPQRFQVTAGCGVVVNSATVLTPTTVDLGLDTTSASTGSCAITTRNPDGQQASASVLQVDRAPVVSAALQPDGLIRVLSGAASYKGDNVYSTTGAGQSVRAKSKRRRHQTFSVRVQNDGTAADVFRVVGPGAERGFRVGYFLGTTNVTGAVVTGTFLSPMLAPGAAVDLRVVVRVRRRASIGSVGSWLVRAASTEQPARVDAVLARVKVVRG